MQIVKLEEFKILDDEPPTPLAAPRLAVTRPEPQGGDYAERRARAILYAGKASGASEGGRNAAGYGLAARVREKFDLNDADLLDILSCWNEKNSPPMDADELADVVKNADRYAKRPAGAGYEPLRHKGHRPKTNDTDSPESKRVLRRRSFANISTKDIGYLIPEVLPTGVIVSLISQEGDGKSTLAGHISAVVSSGGQWPTGGHVQQGDVVIFSHEESPECSIAPRLIANGADMSRVHLAESVIEVNGEETDFDIERDIQVLDDWADELPDLKLVIYDPITSYVACNENSNSEVRHALKPLVDFAERRGVTVLALSHLSKKVDLGMINRTLGSRAWSSVPRLIWALQVENIEDEDGHKQDTGNRFLLCVKCNLGRKPKGLKCTIGDGGRVTFGMERIDRNIDDQGGGIETSRAGEIGDWLEERIGADAVPASEITTEGCHRWNISKQRLGTIATNAGIKKRFSAAERCWVWTVKR